MLVSPKKRVVVIAFFNVVYLVLLVIVMDSKWSFSASRRMVRQEEGENRVPEVVRPKGEDAEERNAKESKSDASGEGSSVAIKVESDVKSVKPRVADNERLIGDEGRKITSGKRYVEARTFVTTAPQEGTASQDSPNTAGYSGHNLRDTFQEEVEAKVPKRRLLMTDSETERHKPFSEQQNSVSRPHVKNKVEKTREIRKDSLPLNLKNIEDTASLSLSTVSRPNESVSVGPSTLGIPSGAPLQLTTKTDNLQGRLLTEASTAGLPPLEASSPGQQGLKTVSVPCPEEPFTLDVAVSGSGVAVAVDDHQVYIAGRHMVAWGSSDARLHAGFHLLALHQGTGTLMAADSFMTWQPGLDYDFLQYFNEIQDGRLLILVGAPDFTTYLGEEVTAVLEDMGALFVDRFAYGDAWCLLMYKGQRVLHEVLVTSRPGHNYTAHDVSPLTTRVTVPRTPERRCEWHATPGMEEQAAFCRTYDGYGAFCSCHEPPWSPRPASPVPYAVREVIPVAVVTARRLPRVLRQVAQLWASPGGLHTPVSIFVDGHSPQARRLASLLRMPVTEHHNSATPGSTQRINAHFRFVLQHVFQQHPAADKAIILEDDLDLAPDFIPFFQQTAPLLTADSGLLCVNAFNRNAFPHTAYDPTRLYRVHSVPGCGWMVRRRVAAEMVRHWPPDDTGVDWDLWLRQAVMGNRDVLVPEVPRTKHVGGGGAHVTGLEQALYHGQRPLNTLPLVTLDLKGAQRHRYLHIHHTAITEAKVVRFTDHPCKVLPLPRHQVNDSFVIYLYQPDETTTSSRAYYVAARCLGLDDHIAYENLQMMYTMSFYGNQLYLVGCPTSPFCLTKDPKDIYRPREEDVDYAMHHPFRRLQQRPRLAFRVRSSYEDEVNLNNLIVFD